jgi:hypothetical protein
MEDRTCVCCGFRDEESRRAPDNVLAVAAVLVLDLLRAGKVLAQVELAGDLVALQPARARGVHQAHLEAKARHQPLEVYPPLNPKP